MHSKHDGGARSAYGRAVSPSHCVVGLGSNLGDRVSYLERAAQAVHADPRFDVVAASKTYETPPMGPQDQGDYLNAAVLVRCAVHPRDLMEKLLSIESELGRERRIRWGPRTIDLDILWWSAGSIDEPRLTVPHPGLLERAFALYPAVDALEAGDMQVPVTWLGAIERTNRPREHASGTLACSVVPGSQPVV